MAKEGDDVTTELVTKIGPNKQFDDSLLADDVILSCGAGTRSSPPCWNT